MRYAVWAYALACSAAWANNLDEERGRVQAQIAAERAALSALKSRQGGVLELMEVIERMALASAKRANAAEDEARSLRKRIDLLERQQQGLAELLQVELTRAGPRLQALYRLLRKDRVSALLAAEDLTSMVRRASSMQLLVRQDLDALRDLSTLARLHDSSLQQLLSLRRALDRRIEAARREAELARTRRAELVDSLSLLRAEAVKSGRLLKDLEASERQLGALIRELESAEAMGGLGALRGRVRLPVQGFVEVPFGKVVNPKFNTVTIQKGVDIRAPLGSPVRAVAEGKVVFASWLRGYGNVLIVDHGSGFHSVMAHLSMFARPLGEPVKAGEVVALVGDTGSMKGSYLYFEIRHRGQAMDPALWFERGR